MRFWKPHAKRLAAMVCALALCAGMLPTAAWAEDAAPTPTPEAGEKAPAEPVNINTADAEELMTLPGIGETRAADIIAYRQANGPFRMVEQLTDVPGIGEGILAGLIDYVTVE